MIYDNPVVIAGFMDGRIIPTHFTVDRSSNEIFEVEQILDVLRTATKDQIVIEYICQSEGGGVVASLILTISDSGEFRWSIDSHEKQPV